MDLERTRKFWDQYSTRYGRRIERTERWLFPGGREWACSQASGTVAAAGFSIDHSERSRLGWIERLAAVKS